MPSPAAPSTLTASPTVATQHTNSSTDNTTSASSTVAAAMPSSSTPSGGAAGSGGAMARPPIMKRHSSQSSHGAGTRGITSPGSASEHHPLRHTVGGGKGRHAKIVLPRNHGSGRNLAKMGRQAASATAQQQQQPMVQFAQEEGKRNHGRQRSHEGDTEIRLPGSLDEERPAMRRNMTAYDLPRNQSRTKLKKNLSHGQLTKLSSGKNLAGLGSTHKALPSPGLKGPKKSRPQSQEIQLPKEQDLHEQEAELLRQQEERRASRENGGPKKVGFAVGSVGGDTSAEDDETTGMEGTEPQEDEWTEESASASPYSTRQNTANNSRRTSVAQDKPPDRVAARLQHPVVNFSIPEARSPEQEIEQPRTESQAEADGTPAASYASDDIATSPKSMPPTPVVAQPPSQEDETEPQPQPIEKQAVTPVPQIRSPLHAAKDHPNPTAKRLTSAQLPAPALLSSISALDDVHSGHGSPAPSLRSARSALGTDGAADQDSDELVSRFVPSASHPSTGSGNNTNAMNTPKTGSFQGHTPENESSMPRARPGAATFHAGAVSPGSTRSGSSGATTPAMGRSRIELRMLQDKALADREAAAERQPSVPYHYFDRRNESLKWNLRGDSNNGVSNSTNPYSMGPEMFQGRFKAVNTELKVVQKFRDPIADSLERLRKCRNAKSGTRPGTSSTKSNPTPAELKTSKSAVSLPARPRQAGHEPSKLSTSASPPKGKGESPQKPMIASKSAIQLPNEQTRPLSQSQSQSQAQIERRRTGSRRGVSFAGLDPVVSGQGQGHSEKDGQEDDREMRIDGIARMLWNSVN